MQGEFCKSYFKFIPKKPFISKNLIQTSRVGREFGYLLSLLQGFALIRPFEGFSQRAIEVIDKFQNPGFELRFTHKVCAFEQLTN